MFTLRRPPPRRLDAVLRAQREHALSYAGAGATRSGRPLAADLPRNRYRRRIGRGERDFAAAVDALRRWEMYELAWTVLHPAGAPVATGSDVLTVVRHFGFWSINPCRVVYVHDATAAPHPTFSFALGTLPGHSERGEERFRVSLDPRDGGVWFDLLAFAGAAHPLVRLGYPLMLLLQRGFARAAAGAVERAVRRGAR